MNLRPIIQETACRLAALRAAVTATIQSQTCNSYTADVVISVFARGAFIWNEWIKEKEPAAWKALRRKPVSFLPRV
jgi:hypothetical protein